MKLLMTRYESEDREWVSIFDTVGGYEVLRTKRWRYMREIFCILCSRFTIIYFGTKNVSVAGESAMKGLLLLLTRVKGIIIMAF